MKSWPTKPLLEIASIVSDRVESFDGNRYYVATGGLDAGAIVSFEKVDFNSKPSRADLVAKQDDVLFARMQSTNKVTLITKESQNYIWSTGFAALRPNANVRSRFLLHYLASPSFQAVKDAHCTGATQKSLPNNSLRKLTMPVPPLAEQDRILKLLDEADALRKLRDQADHRAVSLIPALLHEMFGDPNRTRWDIAELGTLCVTMYRYPTFYGIEYVDDGVPVARIGNITDHGILDPDLSHYVFIPQEVNIKFPRTILECLDIVMAVRGDGSTGKRIGLVTSANLVGANISPNLLRFQTNANVLNPLYLFHFMVSNQGQALIERCITRTAKKTITAKDIAAMKIPVPPLPLQKEFAERVTEIRELEARQATSRAHLDALFQSLLHRAFNNEL